MTPPVKTKIWLVTGASRGFGRIWTEAALQRGDSVAAGVRDRAALTDLIPQYPDAMLPLELDVTDRNAVVNAVHETRERFGRIDVAVGNAGFGLFGALEETTEAAARRQIEVNLFGNLWLLQALAPVFRDQGSGHVLLNTSFGSLVSFGTAGLYGASKFALEGLGESFALEMADFGTKVTLVEPAAYSTQFAGASAVQTEAMAPYDSARDRTASAFAAMPPGDPSHTAKVILTVVDAEQPPLRLMLGAHVLPLVLEQYATRISEWKKFQDLTDSAQ